MNELIIRDATSADCALILTMIRDLARYERAEHEVEATEEAIHESLFGEGATTFGLVCEQGAEAIGFAVYFFNYSTWQGRRGLYLEDLFVTPAARGRGAGKALLKHLATIAVESNCGRFEWSVLDWNQPAIAFYDALGAKPQDEWVRYRLSGEPLRRLASKKTES